MGRPSDFTQEIADQICTKLADGNSLRSICKGEEFPGISTVIRWLAIKEDPFATFRAQYARAREAQADTLFDECLEIADDGSQDTKTVQRGGETVEVVDQEHIQRSRLRVDTRKWMAGKLRPKVYGDKLELSGNKDAPLVVERVMFTEPPAKQSA